MRDKKVLDDIVNDCQHDNDFLKEMLMYLCQSERTLMQFYMIYKFKYILGERLKCDPGWETAAQTYEHEGFAKKFHELYSGDATVSFIENGLFGRKR